MRYLVVLVVTLICTASPASAQVVQTKSLVSAGGIHSSAPGMQLTSNLGDIICGGPAMSANVQVWHGFYTPIPTDVSGVAHDELPMMSFLRVGMPNPAHWETTFHFGVSTNQRQVTIDVYDVSGRRVATIFSRDQLDAGEYDQPWDLRSSSGAPVPSGIYFVRLVTRSFLQTQRLVVVR